MNAQEIQSIENKIDNLSSVIKTEFNQLHSSLDKVEEGISSLDRRLLVVEATTKGIDKRLETTETRINSVESNLPAVSEKFGELKNWRQISLLIIAALAGWFVRGGKF